MQDIEFYQQHLDQVSRSFAFCIARLDPPLRRWVSSCYLICRIVDTIEDAQWDSFEEQSAQFDVFNQALVLPEALEALGDWYTYFPKSTKESELQLIRQSVAVFQDFHEFPVEVRELVTPLILSMSDGMRKYAGEKRGGLLRLSSLSDVNRYCFFVAGLVGEILTGLLALVDPRVDQMRHDMIIKAHHFGLFLQKINILKDQYDDETEGRFFLPSRSDVIESVKLDSQIAFDYITSIPTDQRNYRLFCAWSMFLGLASFPYIQSSFLDKTPLKMPREDAMQLFRDLENVIDDNHQLQLIFDFMVPFESESLLHTQVSPVAPAQKWVRKIYRGELRDEDIDFLGLYSN